MSQISDDNRRIAKSLLHGMPMILSNFNKKNHETSVEYRIIKMLVHVYGIAFALFFLGIWHA